MDEAYRRALIMCADSYHKMNDDDDPILQAFIEEFWDRCGGDQPLPLLKLNRWLGYIQGIVIERGLTTVEAERDWTRPLFRPLDFPVDTTIPL